MTEHNAGSLIDPRTRIRRVKVHRDIFNAYADLHRTATIMTQKMDEVLEHYEHRSLIHSGLKMGFNMPDIEAVEARNALIKVYLDGLDPYRGAIQRDDTVDVPATTARQLHLVAHHSTLMIADVINNIQKSDYMLWIRKLKQGGSAYQGPTSLQEVFNVWGSLITSATYERRHVPDQRRRLPADWIRYVV